MASTVPPIGTRGRYELESPFSADGDVLYTCGAIRSFKDIENSGKRVYETYYEPFDLAESDYRTDRDNDELIVTLLSGSQAPIYVPSSYIRSYPDQSQRNYQHVVLSASVGPLPDDMDLTFAEDQVASALSDVIGLTPDVNVNVMPLTESVSPEEHESREAAREAAIDNRTTDRARRLELEDQVNRQAQRLEFLEQLVKDEGLIPE